MCQERVLILSDQPLFAQGVRALIELNASAKVIGIIACDDQALLRVRELDPNIIIVEQPTPSPAFVMTLLDLVPNVRVICLTLEGNVMRVYDGHQQIAHGSYDLMNAIHPFSEPIETAQ